jgi:hypothetical protein
MTEYRFVELLKKYGVARMELTDHKQALYAKNRLRCILTNAGCRGVAGVGVRDKYVISWMFSVFGSLRIDGKVLRAVEEHNCTIKYSPSNRLGRNKEEDIEKLEMVFGGGDKVQKPDFGIMSKGEEKRRKFLEKKLKAGKITQEKYDELTK